MPEMTEQKNKTCANYKKYPEIFPHELNVIYLERENNNNM